MATFASFYPYVVPHVIGAPEPLLDQVLRTVAIDFCRRSGAYQDIDTQSVVAGVADYDVLAPSGTQLTVILGVWHNDKKLDPAPTDQVYPGTAMRGSVNGYTAAAGTPSKYFQKTPTDPVISLYPVPDVTAVDGLAVRAAFEPTPTATFLPDFLFDKYANAIAMGTAAHLTAMPGKEFSNPVLADSYSRKYELAVSHAKSVARNGQVRKSLRVQSRPFA